MSEQVDIDHLRRWIGTEEAADDMLTPGLASRFSATLGLPAQEYRTGVAAPRLIHFCLAQPIVPTSTLAEDGHPARGGFLPPVPLPNRMWAGSDIIFAGDLIVGEEVRRVSRISDVAVKPGRTGTLCFVTVDHRITGASGGSINDRQTIVYREATSAPARPAETAPAGSTVQSIDPQPTLLFRYSALTFNAHRIHYDHPYATEVEGYPGLVVHGPLQATLLLHLAASEQGGRAPDGFTFKSVSPLYSNEALCLHAGPRTGDRMDLWSARPDGPFAMQAQARWT